MSADPTFVLQPRDGLRLARFDSAGPQPEYVVTLPNGSHYRVTERLREVLECIDGRRTLAELAIELGRRWRRTVTPDQAWEMAQRYLAPHGLLDDGSPLPEPVRERHGFGWHRRLISAGALEPITRLGRHAFAWPVALVGLGAIVWLHVEAYARGGPVAPGLAQSLGDSTFLLAYGLVLASVFVHELGHASACQRFGETYGDIGFGLYLIFPVLYADVTRVWRLGRWQRVVVDLGGVYFQSFVAALYAGLYLLSGEQVFFIALVQINALMLLVLSPLGRLDGYWLVCDALGVANPWRELRRQRDADAPDAGFAPLPAVARAVVWAYAATVAGTIAFAIVRLGAHLPEAGALFIHVVTASVDRARVAWHAADAVGLLAQIVRLVAPAGLIVGVLLALQRALTRSVRFARRPEESGGAALP